MAVDTGTSLGSKRLSYVPAWPTNSTQDAISYGLNITDVSTLHLQWYTNGYVSELVSYLGLKVDERIDHTWTPCLIRWSDETVLVSVKVSDKNEVSMRPMY